MKATLILNPESGDSIPNTEKAPRIQELLSAGGVEADVVFTTEEKPANTLADEAIARGMELVIVGGGDGTISLVAKQLVGQQAKLGILALGTYNNISRSLGIPADIDEACAIITRGHVRQIDAGCTEDDHVFFEAAGAGLDAELFPVGHAIKEHRWKNLTQALRQMATFEEKVFTITLDRTVKEALPRHAHRHHRHLLTEKSIRLKALFVVVANGPYYGNNLTVAPAAKLDDGLLTVCVYRRFSKWELFQHIWGISGGKYRYSPKVRIFHAAEVRLETAEPLLVHGDGEVIAKTPMAFRSLPKALHVLAPG